MATETETAAQHEGSSSPRLPSYAPEHRPMAAHAALASTFAVGFIGAILASRRSGRTLPEGYRPWDVLTAGVASHKIARLVTKDKVTSFVRAPFVRKQEPSGQAEVSAEPRGEGMQYAVGELLTCPYCLGQWVSGAFAVGMVTTPRFTRLIGFMYTAETIADFLQLAYKAAEERA